MSRRFLSIAVALMALAMAMPALTQAQDQGGAPPGGQGGGRGNFDPAAFRERMMNAIKDQVGASDDEWKVLQPKVEKVMTAQMDARAGFGFGGFGRRNRGGDNAGANQPSSPVGQAVQDLRQTLDNKDASATDIAAKLQALRDARAKAKTDLEAAQKELKDVLTPRQEAVLVMRGMLE